MTVYVDELRRTPKPYRPANWRYDHACHILAESDPELEAMAKKLGLRKDWKHGDHYDLTASKRAEAISAGAVGVTCRELVQLRREFATSSEI